MLHMVKHSKVKLFHGDDLELKVDGNASIDSILEDLNCPIERMQAHEPPNGAKDNDLYSYQRGDIPIFNFDEADRVLIATLQVHIQLFVEILFLGENQLFVYYFILHSSGTH